MNHHLNPEAMHPVIPGDGDLAAHVAHRSHRGIAGAAAPSIKQRPRTRLNPVEARSLVGLTGLTTIVATGPFDDHAHAQQLAAAIITVRRHCEVQLVLLGTGEHRAAPDRRTSTQGVRSSVHAVSDSRDYQWSDLVAAADLVVLGSSSGTAVLLDVLAAGRPVVAPADPAIVQLVVPAIVGLVYRPGGDVSGMTEALCPRRLIERTGAASRNGRSRKASSATASPGKAMRANSPMKGNRYEYAPRPTSGVDR